MSTALYRRYRPETFDEVIGQDHVTQPLKAALASGRVTHAYLFSGPRGCGKTTSARIFARCLNCAEGPTDTPCGVCDSCVELARGGSGSLDVVEIDAASHNGVDDARELRERAAYAPARDRYKIFILDEAHMVTPQGFNALLKLVEEPPDHVKFVFATTEPDKVIGTIRSRTHHYPFRLVPPGILIGYLEQILAEEQVVAAAGVLPMVVRAGAGSVRDSLSVLDQLIAGAPDGELSYETAAALLGFTSSGLLDDAIGALAGHDGAALFQVVDRMVNSGHDPRRFVEDLLQRLRDLVILAIAGESGEAALGSLPEDQLQRMREQASHLGAARASRAADLTNAALFEMSGATSPRLQLELLCARLLLPVESPSAAVSPDGGASAIPAAPGAPAAGQGGRRPETPARDAADAARRSPAAGTSAPDTSAPGAPSRGPTASGRGTSKPDSPKREGTGAATEPRQEAQRASARAAAAALRDAEELSPAPPADPVSRAAAAAPRDAEEPSPTPSAPSGAPRDAADPSHPAPSGAPRDGEVPAPATSAAPPPASSRDAEGPAPTQTTGAVSRAAAQLPDPEAPAPAAPPAVAAARESEARPESAAPRSAGTPAAGPTPAPVDSTMVRRRWGEVLETLSRIRRGSWVLVAKSATVGEIRQGVMLLVFETAGLANAFNNGGHAENVELALSETLGVRVKVRAVTGDEGGSGREPGPAAGPAEGGAVPGAEPRVSYPADEPEFDPGEEPEGVGEPEEEPTGSADAAEGIEALNDGPATSADELMAAVERASARRHADAAGGGASSGASAHAAPARGRTAPGVSAPGMSAPGQPVAGSAAHVTTPGQPAPGQSSEFTAAAAGTATAAGTVAAGPDPTSSAQPSALSPEDEAPSPDDPDAADSGLVGIAVIERILGGRRVGDDGR